MKSVKRGFGPSEIIAAIVLIFCLGVASWYIANRISNSDGTIKGAVSQPAFNYTTYKGDDLGFSFDYPASWLFLGKDKNSSISDIWNIEAPGTTIQYDNPNSYVTNGARITIVKTENDTDQNLTELEEKNPDLKYASNQKTITVDKRPALQADLNLGVNSSHVVLFLDNGTLYSVGADQSVYSQKNYANIFEHLISSIKF